MIHLCTVQHTGTWFLIRFLYKHPEVHDYIIEWTLRHQLSKCTLDETKRNIFHCHAPAKDSAYFHILESLMKTNKVVMTVRDPILALTTRHTRHPEMDHTFILKGFLQMHEWADNENVFFFNIHDQREEQLIALLEFLGLEIDCELISEYENNWQAENTTQGRNILKTLYLEHGIDGIRHKLSDEIEFLEKYQDKIQGFMERFVRLSWFS